MKEMRKSLLEKMRQVSEKVKTNKAWKWRAAGIGCLTAGAVSLSLVGVMTGRADTVAVEGLEQRYEMQGTDVYLVDNAKQVLELRDASASVTSGKTFKLKQDITVSLSVRGPAIGEFAGTFDGEGYVLTFTDVNLTSTGTAGAGDVSEGVLFGSVKSGGTVQNLIVELPQDASYTRTSDRGSTAGTVDQKDAVFEAALISGTEVVNKQEDAALYETIDGYSQVYVNKSDSADLISEETYNGLGKKEKANYKAWDGRMNVLTGTDRKTTVYNANKPGNDSFGIISGSNEGTIYQVAIKGTVTVNQQTTASTSSVTEEAERTKTYFYQAATEEVSVQVMGTNIKLGSTGSTSINVLVAGQPQSGETADGGTEGLSIIQTTEQQYYLVGETISYTVKVTNGTNKDLTDIQITPVKKSGSWTDENGSSLSSSTDAQGVLSIADLSKGASRILCYTVTGSTANETTVKNSFSIKGTGHSTATIDSGDGNGLTVNRESAPGNRTYTYTVTVKNEGSDALTDVSVTPSSTGIKWTKLGSGSETADKVVEISSMQAGAAETLQCTYIVPAATEGDGGITFTATGTEENTPTVETVSALYSTEYTYTVTVDNESSVALTDISVTPSSKGIKWTKLGSGSEATEKTVEISSLQAGTTETLQCTYSVPAATTGDGGITFAAEATKPVTSDVSAKTEAISVYTKSTKAETTFLEKSLEDDTEEVLAISQSASLGTGELSGNLIYTVIAQNVSSHAGLSGITLTMTQTGGTWYTEETCTEGSKTTLPEEGFAIPKDEKRTYFYKVPVPTAAGVNTVSNNLRVTAGQREGYEIFDTVPAYKFYAEVMPEGVWIESSRDLEHYAASNLYVGAAAGSNAGTIQQVWQNAALSVAGAAHVTNQAGFAAGQLVGRQTAAQTLASNHIAGTVTGSSGSGASAAEVFTGLIIGGVDENVTVSINDSVIASTGDLVGKADGTVAGTNNKQGTFTAADVGNLNGFTTFQVPVGKELTEEESRFALGWLCKEATFTFAADEAGAVTVSAADGTRNYEDLSGMYLRYQSTDDEGEAGDNSIDTWKIYANGRPENFSVKNSGYLVTESVYATDGNYHLTWKYKGSGTDQEPPVQYLYEKQSGGTPGYTAQPSRNAETGEDHLVVSYDLSSLGITSGTDNKLYYTFLSSVDKDYHSEAIDAAFEGGVLKADLTFVEQDLTLQKACWQVDGKIYPYVVWEDTTYNGTPLSVPNLKTSAYDQEGSEGREPVWTSVAAGPNGTAGTCTVQAGQLFQAGLDSTIADVNYAYYFEDSSENTQKSVDEVEGITAACDDQDQFVAPETAGEYRLYLLIKKPGYASQMQTYMVTVVDKETVQVSVKTPGDVEIDIAEGEKITTGDNLTLSVPSGSVMNNVRYLISATQLSSMETLRGINNVKNTNGTSGSELISRASGQSDMYLYVQLSGTDAGNQTICSDVQEYHLEFLGQMQAPEISPNATSVPKETTLESGTTITLKTDADSDIYYISSSAAVPEPAPVIELVTDRTVLSDLKDWPENEKKDSNNNIQYIRSNDRWYEIKHSDTRIVRKYDSDEKFIISNSQKQAVDWYVYTMAFSDGYEPSPATTYVYYLAPLEKVANPTADLPDKDKDGIRTEVIKESILTFSSTTLEATLYYSLGNDSVNPDSVGDGMTFQYDPSQGIVVEGEYGGIFQVNMIARKTGMEDSDVSQFVYVVAPQETVAAPTATPSTSNSSPTVVIPGEKIVLSTTTRGASIYYTTDGSEPQVTLGAEGFEPQGTTKLYVASDAVAMPSDGSGYFTLKAIAVKADLAASGVVHLTYQYPSKVLEPYATIASGAVDLNTQVSLKSGTEGAVIYYTIAYGDQVPEDPTVLSAVFDGLQPFVITQKTTIKALAVKDNVKSGIVTFTYTTLDKVGDASTTITTGSVVVRGTTISLTAPADVEVYYTLDGSDPSDPNNTAVMNGRQVTLDGELGSVITVKTCTRAEGKSPSDVSTHTYQISKYPGGVGCDTANGTELSSGSTVNLITDVTGAVIYYTVDGSNPSVNSSSGSSVQLGGMPGSAVTVKAIASVSGGTSNATASFNFKLRPQPSAPTASPAGGVLSVATRVTLSAASGSIYYTTDGSDPTEAAVLYTEPVLINRATTLKAVVVSETGERSEVVAFTYTTAGRASAPKASVESGMVDPGTVVTFTSATAGASIYYSMDGTVPTIDNLSDMMVVSGNQFTINRSVQIQAVAYMDGMQLSQVSTYTYEVGEIPAVTEKEAREALLAEEQLKDSDSSELDRRTDEEEEKLASRRIREKEFMTQVHATAEEVPLHTTLVTVEKEKNETAQKNVKSLLGEEYGIIRSYDMKLMQGGRTIQPTAPVEIGIPIPEKWLDAAVQIAYVNGSGGIKLLDTRREDGMAYAKAEHFSNYVLVGVELPEEQAGEFDYLSLLLGLAGVSVVIGLLYFLVKTIQKWRRRRREKRKKR